MLKKLFKKLLFNSNKKNNSIDIFDYILKSDDTILLSQTRLDFRAVNKENRKYVKIGSRGVIGGIFTFETPSGEVIIGNNVHLGHVHFICKSKIEIKDDVTMAWGIILYDHDSHSTDWTYRKNDNHQCYEDFINHNGNNIVNKDWVNVNYAPIKIESKVWVGFDVLILKGVTIGEGAIIAAKSVVTKDVPAWTLAAGNPARVVKQLPKPEEG